MGQTVIRQVPYKMSVIIKFEKNLRNFNDQQKNRYGAPQNQQSA